MCQLDEAISPLLATGDDRSLYGLCDYLEHADLQHICSRLPEWQMTQLFILLFVLLRRNSIGVAARILSRIAGSEDRAIELLRRWELRVKPHYNGFWEIAESADMVAELAEAISGQHFWEIVTSGMNDRRFSDDMLGTPAFLELLLDNWPQLTSSPIESVIKIVDYPRRSIAYPLAGFDPDCPWFHLRQIQLALAMHIGLTAIDLSAQHGENSTSANFMFSWANAPASLITAVSLLRTAVWCRAAAVMAEAEQALTQSPSWPSASREPASLFLRDELCRLGDLYPATQAFLTALTDWLPPWEPLRDALTPSATLDDHPAAEKVRSMRTTLEHAFCAYDPMTLPLGDLQIVPSTTHSYQRLEQRFVKELRSILPAHERRNSARTMFYAQPPMLTSIRELRAAAVTALHELRLPQRRGRDAFRQQYERGERKFSGDLLLLGPNPHISVTSPPPPELSAFFSCNGFGLAVDPGPWLFETLLHTPDLSLAPVTTVLLTGQRALRLDGLQKLLEMRRTLPALRDSRPALVVCACENADSTALASPDIRWFNWAREPAPPRGWLPAAPARALHEGLIWIRYNDGIWEIQIVNQLATGQCFSIIPAGHEGYEELAPSGQPALILRSEQALAWRQILAGQPAPVTSEPGELASIVAEHGRRLLLSGSGQTGIYCSPWCRSSGASNPTDGFVDLSHYAAPLVCSGRRRWRQE